MSIPLLDPLRDLAHVRLRAGAQRINVAAARLALAVVAAGFLTAAGVVALSAVLGFPGTAVIFAVVFAVLALLVHLRGQALAARRALRIAAAQDRVRGRAQAGVALATARAAALAARTTGPVLPLAVLVAAFLLMRRS